MTIKRKLARAYTPQGHPGFLGNGHIARPVLEGTFAETDPFIMLMDDMLDKKDTSPAGGPHPHAGFETVTLMLEGEMGDDKHTMKAGDFQLMTAGSGIVHTETIEKPMKLRIFQLWLNLPQKHRRATPRLQDLPLERVPQKTENGVSIRLYSGSLAGLTSPVQNYIPFILADVHMEAGSTTTLRLPSRFNTFLYVMEGSVKVGEEEKPLSKDQAGWLDRHEADGDSELVLTTDAGTRFALYSGQPTGEDIVSHGPFIADTVEDIKQWYAQYRMGMMGHIADVPDSQKIRY